MSPSVNTGHGPIDTRIDVSQRGVNQLGMNPEVQMRLDRNIDGHRYSMADLLRQPGLQAEAPHTSPDRQDLAPSSTRFETSNTTRDLEHSERGSVIEKGEKDRKSTEKKQTGERYSAAAIALPAGGAGFMTKLNAIVHWIRNSNPIKTGEVLVGIGAVSGMFAGITDKFPILKPAAEFLSNAITKIPGLAEAGIGTQSAVAIGTTMMLGYMYNKWIRAFDPTHPPVLGPMQALNELLYFYRLPEVIAKTLWAGTKWVGRQAKSLYQWTTAKVSSVASTIAASPTAVKDYVIRPVGVGIGTVLGGVVGSQLMNAGFLNQAGAIASPAVWAAIMGGLTFWRLWKRFGFFGPHTPASDSHNHAPATHGH